MGLVELTDITKNTTWTVHNGVFFPGYRCPKASWAATGKKGKESLQRERLPSRPRALYHVAKAGALDRFQVP